MTTELLPEFAVTVRGYDRSQVDDYVDTLREWLNNATLRMQAAEAETTQLREQVIALRQRTAELDQQTAGTPPRTILAIGDRITRMLQLAEEGAVAVQADAEAEARAIVARANEQAEELTRASQARQADIEAFVATASQQADNTLRNAEAHAAEAAARLTAEAETRATNREAQADQRGRELVEAAEAERARVLAELAAERSGIEAELHTLAAQRDEMLAGLTQLRESLQRAIGQVPAAPSGSVGVGSDPVSAERPGETALFDHEAIDMSQPGPGAQAGQSQEGAPPPGS